jgi:hypothetical protein
MRRIMTSGRDMALALIAQLKHFDSDYDRDHCENHEDLMEVRKAFVTLIEGWFATVEEWNDAGIAKY